MKFDSMRTRLVLAAGLVLAGGFGVRSISQAIELDTKSLSALQDAAVERPLKPSKPQNGYVLEADVSARLIPVTVSFSGAHIVIFGSVVQQVPDLPDQGPLDIVAVVQGARSNLVVRKKERVAGIWLNRNSIEFEQVPVYYAVLSSHALEGIAKAEVLESNGIGANQIPFSSALSEISGARPFNVDEFRDAALRVGTENQIYARHDGAIEFLGKSLFRADLELPASVPVGNLDVGLFLFRNGELKASYNSNVVFARAGFEQVIYEFANQRPLLYGICTVLLGGIIGIGASALASLRRR